MNEYHELIFDAVEEMRRERFGHRENVQVYVAADIYREWRQDEEYAGAMMPERQREVQTEPLSVGSPTKAAFGEEIPEFETCDIVQLDGMVLIEEPRLRDGEILLIDGSGFVVRGERNQLVLEHPVCIEKIRTTPLPDEDQPARTCVQCGTPSVVCVEGDEGEPYCSINCLNDHYI